MINLIFLTIGVLFILITIINYIIPYLIVFTSKDQNFKSKYGEWSIVTGGSKGIGEEIVNRLAEQGINIIIISKELNKKQIQQLSIKYPTVKVLTIIEDLSKQGSVSKVIEQLEQFTKQGNTYFSNINEIKILFNNVGYLTMESIDQTTYNDKFKMIQCNTLTAVELTDYLYRIWVNNNKSNYKLNNSKRCIIFTSSITGLTPTPYSAIYASGKAFITCFARSLSIEARSNNVDVLVVQPGKVQTNLFNNLPNLLILRLLSIMSQQTSDIVDIMFRVTGKFGIVVFDSGLFGVASSFITNLIGSNILLYITYILSKYLFIDFLNHQNNNNSNNTSPTPNKSKNKIN